VMHCINRSDGKTSGQRSRSTKALICTALWALCLSQQGRGDINGNQTLNFTNFALAAQTWRQSGSPLHINELMAANTSTAIGSARDYADWIELYNASDESLDLAGMYLTDDLSEPTQWQFPLDRPEQTRIEPKGYVLIWADNALGLDELHANFKLSASGEALGLFDIDGRTLLDSLRFDRQTADISYGRAPDGAEDLRYFGHPTPGQANNQAFLGELGSVAFSHQRGFYEQGFDLTLSCATPDAKIYYTLDGKDPLDPSYRRPPGLLYRDPLRISKQGCVRAAAVLPGWKPSPVETHTFLLHANSGIRSLPVISLVGDEGNTFYEPRGVMAVVGGSYSGGVWQSSGTGSYNNFIKRGYEKPVSFEWIAGPEAMQIDCGLRVHGSDYMRPRYTRSNGFWTGNAKVSFRLYFDSQYGPSWLAYPLFPYAVDRFKTLVLRGGHNDRVNPFIKDELIRRLHQDMGQVASTGTLAMLFINGQHKGYFNPCEHIKDSFFQSWYDSDQDWDVMTMSGIRDGDSKAWNTMLNYARTQRLSQDHHYEHFSTLLDIPAFVDYLILQLWIANWDWPNNNWSAARERSPEGRWRFMIWDAEGSMESNMLSRVGFTDFPSWAAGGGAGLRGENTPIAEIYRGLRVNKNFAKLFGDSLHRHFFNHGALSEPNIRQRFLELRETMAEALPNMNLYILNSWVPQRLDIFLDACIQERMYSFAGPRFDINGAYQHGGPVALGDQLSLSSGRSRAIYYSLDGTDISTGSQVYTGPLTLSHSVKVKARILQGETWSALTEASFAVGPVAESLRVTELMYHPPGTDDPNTEFIELANLGAQAINLNLVTFTDGIDFAFPNLELSPNERVLLVRDVNAFTARYGSGLPVVGQYEGSLSNAGEWIELQDATGQVIQGFRYQDNWYDLTDGAGFSLTLRADALDSDLHSSAQTWRLSAHQGGSPGRDDANDIAPPGSIVINELMANPRPGESDWIELHNTTDQPWDISGWFLSDDSRALRKYEIPSGTVLEPHGYVVFDQDTHFGNDQAPGVLQAFGLSAGGETLYLHGGQDGDLTGYVTQARFTASDPGRSFGRAGISTATHDLIPLSGSTPGQTNAESLVDPL
jgi:hypothetical protein